MRTSPPFLADDRLGLHARLSSALTLDLDDPANHAFGEAFFSEALSRLAALNVEKAFPIRAPKSMSYIFLPVAAAAGLFYLMPYQDALGLVASTQTRRHAEQIQASTALKLEKALQKLEVEKHDTVDEHSGEFKVNQLLQKADSIAKDMKESKRNPDDALAALGALKRDIESEREKIGQDKDFLSRLEKLTADQLNLEEGAMTKEVSEALKMGDAALAARQLRKLAQKMKDDVIDDPNKTDEQKKADLERLQREVEKLAGALNDDEKLSEGLREISKKSMSAAEFESLKEEIKKQAEKQNKGSKKLGDDLEKQMNDVADEMERLDEDNDEKLSEDEDKEDKDLEKLEDDVDNAMEGMNSDDNQDGQEQKGDEGEKERAGPARREGPVREERQVGQKQQVERSGKSIRGKAKKSGKSSAVAGQESRQGGRKGSGQSAQGQGDNGNNKGGQPGNGTRWRWPGRRPPPVPRRRCGIRIAEGQGPASGRSDHRAVALPRPGRQGRRATGVRESDHCRRTGCSQLAGDGTHSDGRARNGERLLQEREGRRRHAPHAGASARPSREWQRNTLTARKQEGRRSSTENISLSWGRDFGATDARSSSVPSAG